MKKNLKVGKYTYGADDIKIFNYGFEGYEINIGAFTSISSDVRIYVTQGCGHFYNLGSSYPFGFTKQSSNIFNDSKIYTHNYKGCVNIGNDNWLGDHISIVSGVTIGDGAVIATNSHVTRNVEPYSIVGGNPAKCIKYRFSFDIINEFLKLKWWDLPDEDINKIIHLLQSVPNMKMFDEIYKILN